MGEHLKNNGQIPSEVHENGRRGVQVLPSQDLTGTPAGEASAKAASVVVVTASALSSDQVPALDTLDFVRSIADNGVRLGKRGFKSSRQTPKGRERQQGRPGRGH